MKRIPAINIQHFVEGIRINDGNNINDNKDYFSYFSDAIDRAKNFAIYPFLVYSKQLSVKN